MPPKTSKITDIAGPGETAPSATSRPLLVESRSVMPNDPMLVGADAAASAAPAVRRSERVLEPVSSDLGGSDVAAASKPADDTPSAPILQSVAAPAPQKPEPDSTLPEPTEKPRPAEPVSKPAEKPAAKPMEMTGAENDDSSDTNAAPDAAAAEAAAAEEARNQELEKLAESGIYTVPINAIQRKRSHMVEIAMIVLGIVLAVALFDAALDSGLLKLSVDIPHTNFLSAQ